MTILIEIVIFIVFLVHCIVTLHLLNYALKLLPTSTVFECIMGMIAALYAYALLTALNLKVALPIIKAFFNG